MSLVFTSTVANNLKLTLNTIVDDKTDGMEDGLLLSKWMNVDGMDDEYEDDLEMAGPGLATEKPEGTEVSAGTIREGVLTRYIARTFGLKLLITEEAIEDSKYPRVLNAGRRLKRALYKTADIDGTNVLARMFNTSYVGGDGLCLGNSAHTLPNGGTFSNIMATPMTPSRAALIVARAQLMKMPGHDGVTEGYDMEAIVCPVEQWGVWAGVVGSEKAPDAGSFNEINVIYGRGIEVIPIKYWTNTTTNWAVKTTAEDGVKWFWRRKARSKTWVDNDQDVMKYGITARWARGWSDPRGMYCVNA